MTYNVLSGILSLYATFTNCTAAVDMLFKWQVCMNVWLVVHFKRKAGVHCSKVDSVGCWLWHRCSALLRWFTTLALANSFFACQDSDATTFTNLQPSVMNYRPVIYSISSKVILFLVCCANVVKSVWAEKKTKNTEDGEFWKKLLSMLSVWCCKSVWV